MSILIIANTIYSVSYRDNRRDHPHHQQHHGGDHVQPDQPEEDAEAGEGVHNDEVKGEGGEISMLMIMRMK